MSAAKLWECKACSAICEEPALLTAPSPFDAADTLYACPACKSVEGFNEICDEPGCRKHASCGFPTDGGYRRTCFDHSDFAKEKSNA